MKKILMSILVLGTLTLFTGCSKEVKEDATSKKDETVNYEGYELPKDHAFVSISPEELDEKISKNENFFVFFGRDSWPYCVEAAPFISEKAKSNNIDEVYYFNVETYDGEKYFKEYNFSGVPNVIYIKDGVFQDSSQLYDFKEAKTPEDYYNEVFKQFFEKNG